jgi:hypothetical protein
MIDAYGAPVKAAAEKPISILDLIHGVVEILCLFSFMQNPVTHNE